MKPTTTSHQHPTTSHRISVEFFPPVTWPVPIGRLPAKVFPVPQSMRDKSLVSDYKRARGASQPAPGHAPVGLLINATKQPVLPRSHADRAVPKRTVKLQENQC